MASWVLRRCSVAELVCGSCDDVIPLGALYFKASNGCVFCHECEPEDESEVWCPL